MTASPEADIDILAFSPHPDDAEIGCSGALLLAAGAGQRTGIVDVTDGERATRGTPEIRRAEREKAAQRLGLATRISLGLPDTLVAVDENALGRAVEVVRRLRPRLVLLPFPEDRHPDHGATTELVRRAVFLAGVRKAFEGPAHRVGAVVHYMIHAPFTPSFVIDVSAVWEERRRVLEAYGSQFGADAASDETGGTALSHPSFMQALDARAVHYGAMIGAARGEPYWQPGPVPVDTLTDVIPAAGGYRMFP
jgi:bacillithiol biosynthesis deacetylase BshB1